MDYKHQAAKANQFLELHSSGKLLILPNVWDPIGARILEAKGYTAAATSSSAISSMLGYKDGERIKLSSHLDIIRRIANSVNIPVTTDIEKGYAGDIAGLKESSKEIIDTGIAGVNIEDSLSEGTALRSIHEQCERIAAVREVSDSLGIHMVINARVDCFMLKAAIPEEERIEETVMRAESYIKAGADCIFPIMAKERETIINLRERIKAPINILAYPMAPSLKELQSIGINRASFGSAIFRSYIKKFENIADQLYNMGDYKCYSEEILTPGELLKYLKDEKEI